MDIAGMKKWGNLINLNPKNNLKPTTGNALSKACCERTKVIKSLKANHNGNQPSSVNLTFLHKPAGEGDL